MRDFFRFARMEGEEATHLYVEGVMEAEQPWWDLEGNTCCPKQFRLGMEEAGDGLLVVHIDSPGGDVTAGMAMYEMLRQRKGKTRCEITWAASAATLIPCGAEDSLISPAGVMMLHHPMTGTFGNIKDLERSKQMLEAFTQAVLAAYTEKTGKSEEEIRALMDEETYLFADEAVKLGLCNGIMPKAESRKADMFSRRAVMLAEKDGLDRLIAQRSAKEADTELAEILRWAQKQ